MADRSPRTRLEQLLFARNLSLIDFVDQFSERANDAGIRAHTSERSAKRWLRGDPGSPRAESRRVLEYWFDEPTEELLGPPKAEVASHRMSPRSEQELMVNAARESSEHAIESSSAIDPSALEQLHAAAGQAARDYYVTPPLTMLTDLLQQRDMIYKQLDRTHKPRQQAELYLLAGQVCGLLSSVSWDLGNADVAEEQARAAYTYGSIIDHPSLRAWARALQVTVALWCRPRRAVGIAEGALEDAPAGTASARLHSVHARALALSGARDEAQSALDAATIELDRAGDDRFLDEVGGELAFDRSRAALCGGAVYVALGDGRRAETEASRAIALFGQMPKERRWGAGALGAQVDLATARTLHGNLAGAQDALVPVFALEPARRTEAITQRLSALGRMLGQTRYRGAIEAAHIGEDIEDFTAASLARMTARPALPSGN
ncbi:hypothetical protein G3I59_13805 [Amycolatopsis rubida]|uniref:XRE family transcriptional regulator n=1 Tax=Amycolatopsis rubida TaxID=112413 RepID=A0ABX0BNS0_9PSEU|nr:MULTISPECIES: hypothetical protein [Amycolatopsis]MYW91650.1 hypothetical protein [Amycolatopsis rubida]NEC56634.1 hypothetical protein [Amycolatopsis rubida]OAP24453.1 hypothetical protein A4R44_04844 [Amycolatopsis sp. M39]